MKTTSIIVRVIAILSLSLFTTFSSLRAQTVKVCIDFNSNDQVNEYNHDVQLSPSTFTAAQKAAIVAQVQANFEAIYGKGNVSVKDAADGPCDGEFVLIDGGNGPGAIYGWNKKTEHVAVVHVGHFIQKGFSGDSLVAGVAETATHEVAHLYGMEHSRDTNSIMCEGDSVSISTARRLRDHRKFTSEDSIKMKQVNPVLSMNTAPESGTFNVSLSGGTSSGSETSDPDEYYDDYCFDDYGPEASAAFGYLAFDHNFIPAASDPGNRWRITATDGSTVNFALSVGGTFYPSSQYGSLYLAEPNPNNIQSFRQALLDFDLTPFNWGHTYSYIDLRNSSGNASGINVNYGDLYQLNSAFGGSVIKSGFFNGFNASLTPKDLVLYPGLLSTAGVNWHPPVGREIVDGRLLSEYSSARLGGNLKEFGLLLDDGSVALLNAISTGTGNNVQTSLDQKLLIPGPQVEGYGVFSTIITNPITTFGQNTVFRYDSAHATWITDTAGLNGAFPNGLAADSIGYRYLGTSSGLLRKRNAQSSWLPDSSFSYGAANKVWVDRWERIYAATYSGVYYSTDQGSSWSANNVGLSNPGSVSSFGDDKLGNVYAITSSYSSPSQLYKSTLGTGSWNEIGQSLRAQVYDQSQTSTYSDITGDSTNLFLSTRFGLFVSSNQGNTWTANNQGIRSSGNYAVAKNAQNTLFIGTDLGVFSGQYGFSNWTKSFPSTGYMTQVRKPIYCDNSNNLYTLGRSYGGSTSFGNTIARSTNGGLSWTEDSLGTSIIHGNGSYYVNPGGIQFIAASISGVTQMFTTSQGSWGLDNLGFISRGYEYISAFGYDGFRTYVAMDSGVAGRVWSYTPGATRPWSQMSNGLNGDQLYTIVNDGKGNLYGGAPSAIYRLPAGSGTWGQIPLPQGVPSNIYYVSADTTGALFATFYSQASNGNFIGRGVYFTKDQGAHWTRIALGDSVELDGLYSYKDTTYVQTTQGVFAYTSRLVSTCYIPEGHLLHFDSVAVKSTRMRTIRLTNFGNDSLSVSSITALPGGIPFSILNSNGGTAVTAPRNVEQVQIQFAPQAAGPFTGTFVITSNATQALDTITVTGFGVAGSGVDAGVSTGFALGQNYPNPVGSSSHQRTTIDYSLGEAGRISIKLYDVLGREASTIVEAEEDAGPHSASFDTQRLEAGVYYYRMESGNFTETKRLTVTR